MPRIKFVAWRVWIDTGHAGTVVVETTGTGAQSVADAWQSDLWKVILVERI